MNKITYLISHTKLADIYSHLIKCNNSFKPPLDAQVNIWEYSEKLFNSAVRFEAWFDNELIGLVAAYFNNFERKTGFITNVSVDPEFGRQGIAKTLINMAVHYAIQHKFNQIYLEVSVHNNSAIQLYKKLGFKKLEITKEKLLMIVNI